MCRVVIIDDCVVTGLTLAGLKHHLIEKHGYTRERILGACCVRGPNPVVPWDKRDAFGFLAQKQDFAFPWGPGSSFEAQLFGLTSHPR
jgi:Phosphoribosyl transferase domain